MIYTIALFLLLNDIDRTAKIGTQLQIKHNFKCDKEALQSILAMCRLSNLSDDQIQKEFLEMHSINTKKVEAA